ncbi:MAG TPA: hypothetical protein VGD56_14350, partial [Gemmatirosa sp.]
MRPAGEHAVLTRGVETGERGRGAERGEGGRAPTEDGEDAGEVGAEVGGGAGEACLDDRARVLVLDAGRAVEDAARDRG